MVRKIFATMVYISRIPGGNLHPRLCHFLPLAVACHNAFLNGVSLLFVVGNKDVEVFVAFLLLDWFTLLLKVRTFVMEVELAQVQLAQVLRHTTNPAEPIHKGNGTSTKLEVRVHPPMTCIQEGTHEASSSDQDHAEHGHKHPDDDEHDNDEEEYDDTSSGLCGHLMGTVQACLGLAVLAHRFGRLEHPGVSTGSSSSAGNRVVATTARIDQHGGWALLTENLVTSAITLGFVVLVFLLEVEIFTDRNHHAGVDDHSSNNSLNNNSNSNMQVVHSRVKLYLLVTAFQYIFRDMFLRGYIIRRVGTNYARHLGGKYFDAFRLVFTTCTFNIVPILTVLSTIIGRRDGVIIDH